MTTTRRRFLLRACQLAAVPAIPTVLGCGSDEVTIPDRDASGSRDGGSSDAGSTDSGGMDAAKTCANSSATFSSNHGHTLAVPMSDVVAGVDKTYTSMGGASHTHDVTVTAAQFATLAAGGSVTPTSTNASTGSAHTHTVTIVCLT